MQDYNARFIDQLLSYFSASAMDVNAAIASIHNQESEKIVINILKKCELEAKHISLQIPLEDVEDRVLYYTGILKTTLHQILKKNTHAIYPKTNNIDFNTHIIILKCLSKFYERKELPSFRLLFKNVNELITTLDARYIQDAEQFKLDVTMLGIDYQTISNGTTLLMEDPKITFERYSYLKKMKQIRQQESHIIYYISERIIDKNHGFYNPWKQYGQATDICSDECILIHAVSRNGFTNGLYCFSATEDDFYKWVVDILLGSLYPSSIVVFDNSPLHGISNSKSITMFDTKSNMKKWLHNHNVPFSDAMNKSQLYQLIKQHPDIEEMPRVDRVIKANGHQVLRLPTHFEDLSPVEHIWQDLKRNLLTTDDLHDEILTMLTDIPSQTYELYEKDIVERENALFLIDAATDIMLDNFLEDLSKTK